MNDIVSPTELEQGGGFSLVQQLLLAVASINTLAAVLLCAEARNMGGLVSCGVVSLCLAGMVVHRLRSSADV